MPRSKSALSIGLFGGSFNPAHSGHLHVANCGLLNLGLDQIWWMVSPQNPLKPKQPPYHDRVESVRKLGLPPRMKISHMETEFGTNYTVQTLRRAKKKWPNHRFVFLMGADNLRQLPQWKGWREIMDTVPIAVIARPTSPKDGRQGTDMLKARLSPAAKLYAEARIPEARAHALSQIPAPAWTYLTLPLNSLSSSALRAKMGIK